MHVHVNVGRPGGDATEDAHRVGGAGASLSTEQIANVWMQYAKFQYVIDEMLQDSRIGSEWAQGLRFNDLRVLGPVENGRDQVFAPRGHLDVMGIFQRLFAWVNTHRRTHTEQEFCVWASGGHLAGVRSGRTVCTSRYPS